MWYSNSSWHIYEAIHPPHMSRIQSSSSTKHKAINTSSSSRLHPNPPSPNPPPTPPSTQTQEAAPELPQGLVRRTYLPLAKLSKKLLAKIAPLHPTRRTPPPCPTPDPKLKEMVAKKLEDEEDLMEEDLKNQVPGWIVMDDIRKNEIREYYRLAEKGEVEHFPGLIQHATEEQLLEGDEEREEVLRAIHKDFNEMLPTDRKAVVVADRWHRRGGWGAEPFM
jgi:hypothetical protein